jgi:uncharacterized protein (DUF433 family)
MNSKHNEWKTRITYNSDMLNGNPCIRNMRITVKDIMSYLSAGMTVEELLSDFPYLEKEDIIACFAYCVDNTNFTHSGIV